MGRWTRVSAVAAVMLLAPGGAGAQDVPEIPELRIELAGGTEREAQVARELRETVARYRLGPWTLTRDIRIEAGAIPHSHPVLTLNTRYLGDPERLLTTYLHEQLHWLEDARPRAWGEAMEALRVRYPEVPPSDEGGARDDESTYRHLLVCDMEYQALATHLGDARAREILAAQSHYEWIYERVLSDPEIRAIALRHSFDVRQGAGGPTGR